METIERILNETTKRYIEASVPRGRTDFARIETELMQQINVRCMCANTALHKDEAKISMPKRLDFARIAMILCAALYVKAVIPPKGKNPELMLWNGRVYAPDQKTIRRAALELNACLTDASLRKIESRMLLILDTEKPYSGVRYVAYKNGVLDTTTGKLQSHSPNKIFLSFKKQELDPDKIHFDLIRKD